MTYLELKALVAEQPITHLAQLKHDLPDMIFYRLRPDGCKHDQGTHEVQDARFTVSVVCDLCGQVINFR